MHKHFLTFSIAVFLHACAVTRAGGQAAADPNDPVAQALETLTTAIFDKHQPLVNEAVSSLPPEVQALAQAAYAALEAAVKKSQDMALDLLDEPGAVKAQNAVTDLASIKAILHETIHDPNAITILQAPQE